MVYLVGRIDIDNPCEENLTRFQRIQLNRFGQVYLGDVKRDGWSGAIDHYAFRCQKHGLVVDYPHSHRQVLSCPKCQKEKENNDSK